VHSLLNDSVSLGHLETAARHARHYAPLRSGDDRWEWAIGL